MLQRVRLTDPAYAMRVVLTVTSSPRPHLVQTAALCRKAREEVPNVQHPVGLETSSNAVPKIGDAGRESGPRVGPLEGEWESVSRLRLSRCVDMVVVDISLGAGVNSLRKVGASAQVDHWVPRPQRGVSLYRPPPP